MKKRVLAALLCVAMAATLLVGCNDGGSDTETGSEGTPTETDQPDTGNASTGLSVEPVVYYPFESTNEGWKVVVEDTSKSANNAYDASVTTGSRTIVDGDSSLADFSHPGVLGQSVYLNRSYAIDLNFEPTNTDAYTISFWVWALGMTDYMPTLQYGSNMAYADGNNVAWANFTHTSWPGSPTYPMLWSRNEVANAEDGTACWPWMWAYTDAAVEDNLQGYKEWVNVTIVVTGDNYTSPVGTGAVGCQLYIDGVLKFDSYDNYNNATYFEVTDGLAALAPELMKPVENQTFEAYFGINYWDTMFKGCVDEFYVFDQALTAADVAALYAKGDATVDPKINTDDEPKENARVLLGENSVGANNYSQAFWTDFSDTWEVKEGTTKTITFKNYHTNLNFGNYMNAVVILQNVAEAHSADPANTAGLKADTSYKEYIVARMDNYAWTPTTNTGTEGHGICTVENDWDFTTSDAFKDATHNATVVLKITNNGTTADIEMEVTSADGTVHHQSYKGIAIDGPLYACLTVEKSCIDITSVE